MPLSLPLSLPVSPCLSLYLPLSFSPLYLALPSTAFLSFCFSHPLFLSSDFLYVKRFSFSRASQGPIMILVTARIRQNGESSRMNSVISNQGFQLRMRFVVPQMGLGVHQTQSGCTKSQRGIVGAPNPNPIPNPKPGEVGATRT